MLKSLSLTNTPELVSLISCNTKAHCLSSWSIKLEGTLLILLEKKKKPTLHKSCSFRGGRPKKLVWNCCGTGDYWHWDYAAKLVNPSVPMKLVIFTINNTSGQKIKCWGFAISYYIFYAMFTKDWPFCIINNDSLRTVLERLSFMTID